MAGEKTLNPQAPEFIPTSLFSNQYYYAPPNPYLFYLHTFSTPLFVPLDSNSYPPNQSLFISSPRVFSPVPLQLPPPPPPVESASEKAWSEDGSQVEKRVVVEKFSSPRMESSKGVNRKRWVLRKGGVGHENQNRQLAWSRRVRNISDDDDDDDDDDQNQLYWRKPSICITPRKNPNKDVLRIQPGSNATTVMIRNVPNKYTRQMLMQFLDEHCTRENQKLKSLENSEEDGHHDQEEQRIISAYDFLYLPIDFRTGMNKSYAFVNFTHPKAVWRFQVASHNQKWELFHSKKIREIACAKIQGKEALVKQFEKTSFACEWGEFLPVCFSPARDGSGELVKQTTIGRRITPTPHRHHLSLWPPALDDGF